MSFLSNRETNPVIQDTSLYVPLWRSTLDTFATTASRRLILAKFDGKGNLTTCAEPAPDVGEAFAAALSNSADVQIPIKGVQVQVKDQYAREAATQIMSLLVRTQGLQIYRDSIYSLCVNKMNHWIGESETKYQEMQQYYFDKSVDLIKFEIEHGYHVFPAKLDEKVGDNPDIQKTVNTATEPVKTAKTDAATKPVKTTKPDAVTKPVTPAKPES